MNLNSWNIKVNIEIKIEKNDPKNASPDAFDYLVYLRIFEGCNLHCEHCFIPANPKKMTINQIENVPSEILKFAHEGSRILIQWHGGEPTALGSKWFSEAIEAINKGPFEFTHGIQTNLMNYNDSWKDIFVKYFDSSVGVSWDPLIRLMKRGVPESNADYEIKFWDQINRLVNDGISPYLVVTGTKIFFEKFKNPFTFFSMMEEKGIPNAHIERLTKTGYARESWNRIGVNNKEWSDYMSRFARAYAIYSNKTRQGIQEFNLSPFDGINESVDRLLAGLSGGYGCLSGSCDTRFHTFDASGYKSGCTALNSEDDNKNSSEVQVVQFFDFKAVRKLRQVDCASCEFKPICSSGCLASEKMDVSGECSGGFGLFSTIKELRQT